MSQRVKVFAAKPSDLGSILGPTGERGEATPTGPLTGTEKPWQVHLPAHTYTHYIKRKVSEQNKIRK